MDSVEVCLLSDSDSTASEKVSVDIHDHGWVVGPKRRVRCNHCNKEMTSFSRLKYHLGGIGTDVKHCEQVPHWLKEHFRCNLLEEEKDKFTEKIDKLRQSDLPLKRNGCHSSSGREHKKRESSAVIGEEVMQTPHKSEYNNMDPMSMQTMKITSRFFYETGIDLNVSNSPTFDMMLNATLGQGQPKYKIPSINELKGWLLESEYREMQEYVKNIKKTWEITGCSILLDRWIDDKHRDLVSFLVECPQGTIYLNSYDISSITDNVGAMQLALDGVVKEIGFENVVQIVSCSADGWMKNAGKQFTDKNRTIFWTVSASHCIGLMLNKIGMMDFARDILHKAKTITKFIYGCSTVLKLWKDRSCGSDLIRACKIKQASAFMTLENMLTEKKTLKSMFLSSEWQNSFWANEMEGKKIVELVESASFWAGVDKVVKVTTPLVRTLLLILAADKPQIANLYETMDQVKETIKNELSNKSKHQPFWEVIDEVWDTYLHSPLHAAAFYLNPCLFYSTDFYSDTEVGLGLSCCIVKTVQGPHNQDLVISQLNDYRLARGSFQEGKAIQNISSLTPVEWWSQYGRQYPELQKFAIRILSQTCEGAVRYGLHRSVAEKLLISGRNAIEQQRMSDFAFVHYNLNLQNFWSTRKKDIIDEEIDPMDPWIVDEGGVITSQKGKSEWMDVDKSQAPSNFQPKGEPC